MNAFLSCFRRDVTAALRHIGQFMMIPVFFILAVMLFPLALGPDAGTLQTAAPGLLMIAALFSSLLPLERLFTEDKRDGTLDALMLCPAPLSLYVAGKLAAHWLFSGLPLLLVAPVMAIMLGLPPVLIPAVIGALALVTGVLSLIGAIGAALTLGTRAGTVLLALTIVPLYIPSLVFGAGAIDLALTGFSPAAPLFYLGAILALALPLTPLAAAAILRMQLR